MNEATLRDPLSTAGWQVEVQRETLTLQRALRDREVSLALKSYAVLEASNPRRLIAAATPSEVEALLRPWFEAWDDVIQGWWCADGEEPAGDHWRRLLLPSRGRFGYPMLQILPLFLRMVSSGRIGEAGVMLELADASDVAEQGRALGRYCLRRDGGASLDYAAAARALDPELRAFLTRWFLCVHMISPISNVDPTLRENRVRAMDGFVAFHAEERVELEPQLLFGSAAYRSYLMTDRPAAFLAALSRDILEPGFGRLLARVPRREPPARKQRGKSGAGKQRKKQPKGVGLLLSCWSEDHAVRRCMDPLLDGLRDENPLAYLVEADPEAAERRLPAGWRDESVRLRSFAASSLQEYAAAAARIRERGLDFLFYPEVGLGGATRWLATQRLARVQATGYGHPVTTGSSRMDYFVGGRAFECDPTRYSERLVLLPGLGVGSTVPPAPTRERRRPLDDEEVRFVCLGTFDKLTEGLCRLWNGMLREVGPAARLELMPALAGDAARRAALELGRHFDDGRTTLLASMPRLGCVDRLQEADVYLETFPVGGYNSTIEALAAGLPVVTLEQPGKHGTATAAMLRMLGLPGFLVAGSPEEYAAAAVRLAREPALRLEIRAMLDRERVLATFCGDEMAAHFAEAVRWMREAGPANPGAPVLIEAGEAARTVS